MIGEKVRELRLRKKLTQAELAGDFITRNMLSQIENGVATPSVSTVWELAKRLNVPAAYFFTEAGTLDDYRKIGAMEKIKKLYAAKEYERCLAKLRELDVSDDETELLCAWSSLACGIERYRAGYLKSARSYFEEAFSHAKKACMRIRKLRAQRRDIWTRLHGSVQKRFPLCKRRSRMT